MPVESQILPLHSYSLHAIIVSYAIQLEQSEPSGNSGSVKVICKSAVALKRTQIDTPGILAIVSWPITLVISRIAGIDTDLLRLTTTGQVGESSISTVTALEDGLITLTGTSLFIALKASTSILYHFSLCASRLIPLVTSRSSASWHASSVLLIISTLKLTALSVVSSTYTSVTSSLTILSNTSNNCSGITIAQFKLPGTLKVLLVAILYSHPTVAPTVIVVQPSASVVKQNLGKAPVFLNKDFGNLYHAVPPA